MKNLDKKAKRRVIAWILEMQEVIRKWDEMKHKSVPPEKMLERNARRNQRRRIAKQIIRKL